MSKSSHPHRLTLLVLGLATVLAGCSERDTSLALGILARERVALTATASEIVMNLPVAEGAEVSAGECPGGA